MLQTEFIGEGSISNLGEILSDKKPKNIFLVTGKTSYEKSGAKKTLGPILKDYNSSHFFDFDVNPKIEDVKKGINMFKENNCDFVIAVGGGSVMDTAKLIRIFAANQGEPADYIKKQETIENEGKPLVVIPTTSGSGAEATHFAAVYIGKTKNSLAHQFVLPDYVVLAPQFTMSLPKYHTAYTGMDALGQAIESYWGINSTEESKKYASEAIELVMGNLKEAVNNPSEESRERMAKAAFLAGKAINISMTTTCHAISYPLTSYFGVPHGHGVAITLAKMLVYNSRVTETDVLDKRGVGYVKKSIKEIIDILGTDNAEEASKKITNLIKEIWLSTRLNELGIKTDKDIEIIIKNGFNPDKVKNNPRKFTEEALRRMLDEIR